MKWASKVIKEHLPIFQLPLFLFFFKIATFLYEIVLLLTQTIVGRINFLNLTTLFFL